MKFVQDRAAKAPAKALRDALVQKACERGLLLGCGQAVVRIAPPLTIERPMVMVVDFRQIVAEMSLSVACSRMSGA